MERQLDPDEQEGIEVYVRCSTPLNSVPGVLLRYKLSLYHQSVVFYNDVGCISIEEMRTFSSRECIFITIQCRSNKIYP